MKFFILALVVVSSGCTTLSINRYAASAENVALLRKSEHRKINVGPFTDPHNKVKIDCRAVPLYAPEKESFAEYIRKALISDLIMADIYDDQAPVTLSGVIDKIDVKSTSGAFWDIQITIKSSNGHSFKVSEKYKFESAFDADNACRNAVQAFVPAVQNLIRNIIKHPDFKQLIAP